MELVKEKNSAVEKQQPVAAARMDGNIVVISFLWIFGISVAGSCWLSEFFAGKCGCLQFTYA